MHLTCCFWRKGKNRIMSINYFALDKYTEIEGILFCSVCNSQTITVKAILILMESVLLRN